MKYIIMCGGPRSWKPLQKIKNQTLVERTIQLLKQNDVSDIAISTNDEAYEQISIDQNVPILKHDNPLTWDGFRWLKAFYPMTEPVCYVNGDVFFSPEAIRKIVITETDDILFFASTPPFNERYIKRWAEPFAFKVKNTTRFFECIAKTRELGDQGRFKRQPCSWELWQVITNTELNRIDYASYIAINDYTVDVDDSDQALMLERFA